MEEENKGVTLKGIFSTIWLRKWVALIVGVAVVLICAISLNYLYNPNVKTCEMEFSLNLPGGDGGGFYSYPDGKLFHYTDLTSTKTLEEVKEDGDFANVKVEKMVRNSDIGITRVITTTTSASSVKDAAVEKEVSYTISVKLSYFNDRNQAKDFLTDIANYPAKYLDKMVIDYSVYIPLAEKAKESGNNTTAIEYLGKQLTFLSGEYEKLKTTYGETFVVGSGKTLLACANEIDAYSVNGDDLDESITAVKGFTSAFQTTSKDVYSKATSVAFTQPSIVVEKGGMSLKKIALISVVIAVVVALIAAYVAGYLALKKKKAVENNAENTPSEEAPAAEEKAPEKENKD